MLYKISQKWLYGTLGVVVVLFIDQVTKWLFASDATVNIGIGMGWASQLVVQRQLLLFSSVVLIALGLMAKCWWQRSPIMVGLFFGGAISNILDRFLIGGVRDWLPLPFVGITNNLADWAIFFSLVWMFGVSLANKKVR